jgi:hypothetical protein
MRSLVFCISLFAMPRPMALELVRKNKDGDAQ